LRGGKGFILPPENGFYPLYGRILRHLLLLFFQSFKIFRQTSLTKVIGGPDAGQPAGGTVSKALGEVPGRADGIEGTNSPHGDSG